MKRLFTSLLFLSLACLSNAQNPIIFQPGPGLNDSTDQGGINSGKDACTNEGSPTANYGAVNYDFALPVSNCNPTNMLAYFQFDLTSLPAQVDSVFLGITHWDHTSYCYSNCDADFYFAALLAPWYEQTIDYTNAPAHDTAFYGPVNITFPNSFGTREYNITTMYNLWKSGTVTNNGFVIYSPTVGCNNAAVGFYTYSSDDTTASNRPYLKVYQQTIGMHEQAQAVAVNVSPNPAKEKVNITASAPMIRIRLYNALGEMVIDQPVNTQQYELALHGLIPGVYFLDAITETGTITRRIIVQD